MCLAAVMKTSASTFVDQGWVWVKVLGGPNLWAFEASTKFDPLKSFIERSNI